MAHDGGSATEPTTPRQWAYGELSLDAVIGAALELTKRAGLESLSMRKLAAELGASTTNTYYYVRSKRELLDLVADVVLGEIPAPDPDLPWDRRLATLFASGRRVLLRYPGVADHLLVRSRGHANERRLYGVTAAITDAAGIDRSVGDQAQRVLTYMLFGAVATELATARAADDERTLVFPDDEDVYRFGLELVIDGLRRHTTSTADSDGDGDGG